MKSELKISFQIVGSKTPPSEITQLLNIKPKVELLQGQKNPTLVLPRQNTWAIESNALSDEVFDHWESIKEKLIKSEDKIKEILKSGHAKITIVINSEGRIPSIIIPPDLSRFAADINAIIDIDHLQY